MENFNKTLLKTAFSCMACDGNIDIREIELIKELHSKNKIFGDIDINKELDALVIEINKNSDFFLKNFFNQLKESNLTENDELKLIEIAIETIKADDKIEYNEIKFFKIIRSKLTISNDLILEKHPDFEDYLEQDIITNSYLSNLQKDFLNNNYLGDFELISNIKTNDN